MIVSQGFGLKPTGSSSGGVLSFTQDVSFLLEANTAAMDTSTNAADALSANTTNVALTCDTIYEVTAYA